MGFGNKRQRNNNRNDNRKSDRTKEVDNRPSNYFETPDTREIVNNSFETFYKALEIIPNDEWDSFIKTLRSPLPACFRLNPTNPFTATLKAELKVFSEKYNQDDGNVIEQLPWYPDGNAYKVNIDRKAIRKTEEYAEFHEWLKLHTNNGNITRQEAVSMVPPLALNVNYTHRCLDTCAAPGSKTTQLLEVVTKGSRECDGKHAGYVVANDANTDRAYMLVHQCRRLSSPYLMVTTHQGQSFPSGPRVNPDTTSRTPGLFDRVLCDVPCSGDGTMRKNPIIWEKWAISGSHSLHPLQLSIANRGFQMLEIGGLLVYSTCSMSPYEDEAVVAELLRQHRGELELVDGRQYIPQFKARAGITNWHVLDDAKKKSNKRKAEEAGVVEAAPIAEGDSKKAEDTSAVAMEAVVSEATGDSELKVVAHENPLIQSCIDDGNLVYYATPDDVPFYSQKKIRKSAFPPTEEEISWMNLHRCLRCVPHDEDTGGFFVATLRKLNKNGATLERTEFSESKVVSIEDIEVEGEAQAHSESASDETTEIAPQTAQSAISSSLINHNKGQAAVGWVKWEKENYQTIADWYQFDPDVLPQGAFYYRNDPTGNSKARVNNPNNGSKGKNNEDNLKSIYYVPDLLRDMLPGGESAGLEGGNSRIKVVSVGIKAFERRKCNVGKGDQQGCEYRMMQEAIPYLAPYCNSRKVNVSIQDLCNMLQGGLVSYHTLSDSMVNQLYGQSTTGSVICTYHYKTADTVENASVADISSVSPKDLVFYIAAWKGKSRTMNVMASRVDLEAIRISLTALNVYRPKITKQDYLSGKSTDEPVEGTGSIVADEKSTPTVIETVTKASLTEL